MLLRSMKSFVGWDSYWDIDELVGTLPYIKITTGLMVFGFAIFHISSGYVGGEVLASKKAPSRIGEQSAESWYSSA